MFKVCKPATDPAKRCTANSSCRKFEYKLQSCSLGVDEKENDLTKTIVCKKVEKSNILIISWLLKIENLYIARKSKLRCDVLFLLDFCPDGYKYLKGESQGGTLNSGIFLSLEDCAKECRTNHKCKSFEHNIFDNLCTLNSVERPNSPQEKEFVFCSKIGKIFLYKFI